MLCTEREKSEGRVIEGKEEGGRRDQSAALLHLHNGLMDSLNYSSTSSHDTAVESDW